MLEAYPLDVYLNVLITAPIITAGDFYSSIRWCEIKHLIPFGGLVENIIYIPIKLSCVGWGLSLKLDLIRIIFINEVLQIVDWRYD